MGRLRVPVAWLFLAAAAALVRDASGAGAKPTDPGEDFRFFSAMYRRCEFECGQTGCASATHEGATFAPTPCVPSCARNGVGLNGAPPPEFPLAMRLTGWDCAADCRYRCMRTLEDVRATLGLNAAKYFGKWSFDRVAGVQELISSSPPSRTSPRTPGTSPGSLAPPFEPPSRPPPPRRLRDPPPPRAPRSRPCGSRTRSSTSTAGRAPRCSTRGTPRRRTTRITLGANGIMFFAVFAAFVRRLGPAGAREPVGPRGVVALRRAAAHVAATRTPAIAPTGERLRFRHALNMRVMILCSVAHWTLMLLWAFGFTGGVSAAAKKKKHPGRVAVALACASFHVAAAAEVFDWPPALGLVDAHAVWHCGTPLSVWLWNVFVRADVEGEDARALAELEEWTARARRWLFAFLYSETETETETKTKTKTKTKTETKRPAAAKRQRAPAPAPAPAPAGGGAEMRPNLTPEERVVAEKKAKKAALALRRLESSAGLKIH